MEDKQTRRWRTMNEPDLGAVRHTALPAHKIREHRYSDDAQKPTGLYDGQATGNIHTQITIRSPQAHTMEKLQAESEVHEGGAAQRRTGRVTGDRL